MSFSIPGSPVMIEGLSPNLTMLREIRVKTPVPSMECSIP